VIEEVRVANPGLDWSDVCSLFIEKNQKTHPSRINRKWFETFVVGYAKRKGVATASPGPASEEDEAIRLARLPKLERVKKDLKNDDYHIVWMIGGKPIDIKSWGISEEDFIRFCENMPDKTEAEACRYLRKLTGGKDWNISEALIDFEYEISDSREPYEIGSLFWKLGGKWRGVYYETAEEKAERIESDRAAKEETEKAAEIAAGAQRAAELARQHAEQIRKEREDAERQEREKAAAILKQQAAEEKAKREAAEREEAEKAEKEFKEKFASAISIVGEDNARFKMFRITVNFGQAANVQKDRLREDLTKRGFTWDEACEIISAIEGSKLNWWKPDIDVKREKQLSALMDKTVGNGCTEGEALAAAEKVQELRAKYGIGLGKSFNLKETEEAAIA
jgi:hypothetical protein